MTNRRRHPLIQCFQQPILLRYGLLLALGSVLPAVAFAQSPQTPQSRGSRTPVRSVASQVGIDQKLDSQVPLDLMFRDESGKQVQLGDYFHDQPVVLALVYHRCPMLCNQVLSGLLKSSQGVKLTIGHDYQVIAVSIDPSDTPQSAAEKKRIFVDRYRREGGQQGWHFLTGEQPEIEKLAAAVGFRYVEDPKSGQFAHGSGIMVVTPKGRLSRYLYGIDYSPRDLQLSLVESAQNRIGSPVDQFLLLCFHYDPLSGKYGLAISSVLRVAGITTVLTLGVFIAVSLHRERRRARRAGRDVLSQSPPSSDEKEL